MVPGNVWKKGYKDIRYYRYTSQQTVGGIRHDNSSAGKTFWYHHSQFQVNVTSCTVVHACREMATWDLFISAAVAGKLEAAGLKNSKKSPGLTGLKSLRLEAAVRGHPSDYSKYNRFRQAGEYISTCPSILILPQTISYAGY